jgi:hypothetical protein
MTTTTLFGPNDIQTYTGKAYNFADPHPMDVDILDIAHALSQACRFAGHTKRFYSVAEHSVLVCRLMQNDGFAPMWQRAALLHDSHEAYVWDCPRPFKPLLGKAFEAYASKADRAIAERFFGHPGSALLFKHDLVKDYDDTALVHEAKVLMAHGVSRWPTQFDVEEIDMALFKDAPWGGGDIGLTPVPAERAFLQECKRLEIA